MDLADAFERETGVALRVGTFGRLRVLLPDADRYGAFALVVGARPDVVFPVRSYGDVHAIVWRADEQQLDAVLRRITRA